MNEDYVLILSSLKTIWEPRKEKHLTPMISQSSVINQCLKIWKAAKQI
jgi:hypothetical protein